MVSSWFYSYPRSFLVIITSYGIAATNFSDKNVEKGVLAKVIFHRVILDEAHMIKNESTRMAVAW
jgi:SNF2 family DNA or RNA helicase